MEQKKKFKLMWSEEDHNYFDLEPSLVNFGVKAQKKFGCGIKEGIMFGKEFHAEFYLSQDELKRNHEEGYNFLMDKDKFSLLLNEIQKSSALLTERIKVLVKTDLKKLNNEELWDIYGYFGFGLGEIFTCYSMTQPHKIAGLEQALISFLRDKEIEDVGGVLLILTTPRTRFIFTNQGNHLFKSFSETVKQETAEIDKSVAEYQLYKEEKKDQSERDNLLAELSLPKNILHMANVLRTLAEERLKMRFVWMKALYFNELFFEEFKRRFGVSKKDLRMYDDCELEKLVLTNSTLSQQTLKNREKGFVKFLFDGKISTYEGSKAEKFMLKIYEIHNQSEELTGMVACRGYAVGKAIVLSYKNAENHSEKISKMRGGEIIVTEMTRPNIVVACEKAGAIVTDEGGITCHAAIISREFGIPCIVGTDIATEVIKDGDHVEVDANKGIVRKLNINKKYLKN